MIEKLKNTYDILNSLDNQNSKKFLSSEFKVLNEILDSDLRSYIKVDNQLEAKFSIEEKALISNIIYKIEELEAKMLPKANLINSFADSLS